MNIKKQEILNLLELAVRIWTVIFVIAYGIGKYSQFKNAKSINVAINKASDFEIMWAFFGATQTYPLLIGVLQVVGALLFVFKRTKLLGALLLTPIFLNIILLDILYGIPFGALLNAIIFQCVFLFVIIQQRAKISNAFKTLVLEDDKTSVRQKLVMFTVAFIIAIVLFIGYQFVRGAN